MTMSRLFGARSKKPDKRKSSTRHLAPLFDWASEHVNLATPANIVRALRTPQDYWTMDLPTRLTSAFDDFLKLDEDAQQSAAQAWFDDIVPGHLKLQSV